MNKLFFLFLIFALSQTAKSQVSESDTVWSKEIGSEVKAVKFSPDGQFIYAAALGRKPMKLSTESGEILKEYEGFVFEGNVFFLAMDISSDGKWLICGAYGNDMHIFDTESGEKVKTLKTEYEDNQSNKFNTVSITQDKRYIIATNMFEAQEQETMNGIVIWDAVSGELKKTINSRWAMKMAVSPVNNYFCVSYYWPELDEKKSAVELYDLMSLEKIQDLGYHDNKINDIAFSPDGSLLASGGMDGVIKIWDVNQKKLVKEFPDNFDVYSVSFIGNDKVIAGCGYFGNRYINIYEIKSEKLLGQFRTDFAGDIDISETKHYCVVANATGILVFDYLHLITGVNDNPLRSDDKSVPNPTNNYSEISFLLPSSGITLVAITDSNAREIEVLYNGFLEQGEHTFQWLPKGVSNGIYFCNITGKNFSKTLKIILEK